MIVCGLTEAKYLLAFNMQYLKLLALNAYYLKIRTPETLWSSKSLIFSLTGGNSYFFEFVTGPP